MSEPSFFTDTKRQRVVTYIILGVFAVGMTVTGLLLFSSGEHNSQAQQKANQLNAALAQAGLAQRDPQTIMNSLGDDGGAVCEDPGSALKTALRDNLASNGAAGPGMRPVFIAERAVQGELLILQVYCPDQVPEFTEYIDSLKLDDVIRDGS